MSLFSKVVFRKITKISGMKKLKIYLDTSVISYLDQQDAPERMKITKKFWNEISNEMYDVVISDIAITELAKNKENKLKILFEYINQIEYISEPETEESAKLVESYLKYGTLSEKSRDDLRHIALATVSNCDVVVSWNFKHFVNLKTINKVQAINKLEGYAEIQIMPPNMILGDDENE